MKIIFPDENHILICYKCKNSIELKELSEMGNNVDCEDYFCNFCTDFVSVKSIPI